MIACLRGALFAKAPEGLVIDVGGVGYQVHVPRTYDDLLPAVGEEVFLHIHTDVREDAITLYGFSDLDEKRMFLLLLGISGVGPKQALNILSGLSAADLARAIGADDIGRLTRIPGVGKKTAERLCLELKDKVRFLPERPEAAPAAPEPADQRTADAVSALVNLGYPPARAQEAVKAVQRRTPSEQFAGMRIEELLRQALRSLA
ncbi:MAG: Holliday junction branch migration protein RuvA [Desulfobacteraceae bacterium]|nr:Holliday junction branch migration protein RuvA [Desulfobacteraceae bacterium]